MKQSIGIREFVEFLLRAGDLSDNSSSKDAAYLGTAIHKKIQKQFTDNTEAEVFLRFSTTILNEEFFFHGRADGVTFNHDKQPLEVIEIKTSDKPFEELSENKVNLYWAQAKLYGYFLMQKYQTTSINLRLHYVCRPNRQEDISEKMLSFAEADNFFKELVHEFEKWIKLRQKLHTKRNDSIKTLDFPFPNYRKNQRELAVAVYKTILTQQKILTEAPTGTGKTISTLFPAIKSLGEQKAERIFYLTAKKSTRKIANDTINLLAQKGLEIKSIVLTSKEQITFPEEVGLDNDKNPFYIGYYDRLSEALFDVLENESQIDRQVIEKYARKHTLDPFEFSLDLSLFCDIVICDYNYLFDPLVYLQRFFSDKNTNHIFLVDEAHNLVSRSRDMYTKEISASNTLKLLKVLNKAEKKPQKLINELNKLLNSLDLIKTPLEQYQQDSIILEEKLKSLCKEAMYLCEYISDFLSDNPQFIFKDELLEFFLEVRAFVKISDFYDENFRTHLLLDEQGDLIVKIFCLDSSHLVLESLNLGGASILFSATLTPLSYYQEMFGLKSDGLIYQLPTPFDPNNMLLLSTPYLNVTYRMRQKNLPLIINAIYELISQRQGNYLIFLPSYNLLETVVTAFKQSYPTINTIIQKRDIDEQEQAEFLARFDSQNDTTLVGFALLGGSFSEGIDLKGDRLIGVGIVTVGLPGLNDETDALRDFFDKKDGMGFEYAYQLPGLNNIFQASGRVIRSATDKGVVLLIDSRFSWPKYRQYFPPHWQNIHDCINQNEIGKQIANFWKNN